MPRNTPEKFWLKLKKADPETCWNWPGSNRENIAERQVKKRQATGARIYENRRSMRGANNPNFRGGHRGIAVD